jgi:hypothetical protein
MQESMERDFFLKNALTINFFLAKALGYYILYPKAIHIQSIEKPHLRA